MRSYELLDCGAPSQPVFKLGDSDELQPTTPNPAQLRRDVLIEEVTAAPDCLRSLTGLSASRGENLWEEVMP